MSEGPPQPESLQKHERLLQDEFIREVAGIMIDVFAQRYANRAHTPETETDAWLVKQITTQVNNYYDANYGIMHLGTIFEDSLDTYAKAATHMAEEQRRKLELRSNDIIQASKSTIIDTVVAHFLRMGGKMH